MRGELKLHQKAIKGLCYSKQQDMLFSAAFEEEGVGWDLNTRVPSMKLKGHRMPLISIGLTVNGGVERAVTLDVGGKFMMWDIRSGLTGTAICLQSFVGRGVSRVHKYLMFTCTAPHPEIIASSNRLHKYNCEVISMNELVPRAAIYNPVSRTILTCAGGHVRIWDAVTGEISEDFFNLSPSSITAVILDDRKRKFIVSNADGEVRTYNYSNGVLMKESTECHSADVVAMECVGRGTSH